MINDGATVRPAPGPRRGAGLDDLAARAAESGRLVAASRGDRFVLTADVPA
ncbi:hypothetical protein ACIBI9_57780 [Nonomuraea sp. NPDC050451]|uniref:hypothetical protein n=1 Tax=Nonomuraea sp. NPDC050451 TaxID=3364364 RepID=UPI0037A9714C